MKNLETFESMMSSLSYSGGDVTKMPVIGKAITAPIGPFDSAEYGVVEIIKDSQGRDVYVCDRWYKENKRIPQLIHSMMVDQYVPSETNEDTSATGGPAVGGMGAVVSANPSSLAGSTIGTSWSSGGGTTGSGDVGVPYNAGGPAMQKVPVPMGKGHGALTGKKSRVKKLDMKALKDIFSKRQDYTSGEGNADRPSKVMSFDAFQKDDVNVVKKESFEMNAFICERCGEPTDGMTTMSAFNQDVICIPCKAEEKKDPDYDAAVRAEEAAIRRGDYNFPGVYPEYKPLRR